MIYWSVYTLTTIEISNTEKKIALTFKPSKVITKWNKNTELSNDKNIMTKTIFNLVCNPSS
jgi:hypothetical protein